MFFEVDDRWLQQSLRSNGIDERAIEEILGSLTDTQARRLRARTGAIATVDALKKAGFFATPNNRKLFAKAGLLDE